MYKYCLHREFRRRNFGSPERGRAAFSTLRGSRPKPTVDDRAENLVRRAGTALATKLPAHSVSTAKTKGDLFRSPSEVFDSVGF